MPRILAYLASVRPLEGIDLRADLQKQFDRGQALVRRMAFSAEDTDHPRMLLTLSECADVVAFLEGVEPIEPREFFSDPKGAPSHQVGYYLVLSNLGSELRRHAKAGAGSAIKPRLVKAPSRTVTGTARA
jgi:hypothetical protein